MPQFPNPIVAGTVTAMIRIVADDSGNIPTGKCRVCHAPSLPPRPRLAKREPG